MDVQQPHSSSRLNMLVAWTSAAGAPAAVGAARAAKKNALDAPSNADANSAKKGHV